MIAALYFLLVLVPLVLVHEWGHFIVARLAKIPVEEFAIGFPPRLFSWKRKGTIFSLNLLPLGGYVKILGENDASQGGFAAASRPRQLAVLVAGVAMNAIAAWVLFTAVFLVGVPASADDPAGPVVRVAPTVLSLLPDSPAARAGLLEGDRIVAISQGDTPLPSADVDAIIASVSARGGTTLSLSIERKGKIEHIAVVPALLGTSTRPVMGVALGMVGTLQLSFFAACREGALLVRDITTAILGGMKDLVTSSPHDALAKVSGPVGIAKSAGAAGAQGVGAILFFMGIMSLNLAVFNLLPIPGLDGGRALIVCIEAVVRRPLAPKAIATAHGIGLLALLALVLVVTVREIGWM